VHSLACYFTSSVSLQTAYVSSDKKGIESAAGKNKTGHQQIKWFVFVHVVAQYGKTHSTYSI